MNKFKLPMLLTATMFATVFTLSCSSGGDGDGSSSGLSDLPTQLYMRDVFPDCWENGDCEGPVYGDTYEYNGDGDITITLRDNKGKGDKNTFYVGKIKNGKIIWELPELSDDYFEEGETIIMEPERFNVEIPSKSCIAILLQTLAGEDGGMLVYSSKDQKYIEEEDDETIEINLSKGWNAVYFDKSNVRWEAFCNVGTDID